MFSKNKRLVILIVISLYITGVFFDYSGDLFSQIQKIRRENYIKKIKFCQTRTFSLEEWESFSNKTEIRQNNIYYDVICFQKFHSKVIAKVVKDDLENEFRFMISQIFNKHKAPPLEKKHTFISKHIVQKDKINFIFKFNFKIDKIENYETQFNLKTRSFIYSLFEPPS
jgi:hypothetical protein